MGPLKAVAINAFAREALSPEMDFAKYEETRDESLILERDGMKAPRFTLKPLRKVLVAETIDTAETRTLRSIFAFQYACHEVDLGDGTVMRPDKSELNQGLYGHQVASYEWVDRVADAVGLQSVYEMGDLAVQRSRLKAGATGPFVLWAGTAGRR